MKIGIIGCGRVASALGRAWGNAGHSVFYGIRNKESKRAIRLLESQPVNSYFLPVNEAIECSEIILYAAPYEVAEEVLRDLDFSGKVLIDATNPFKFGLKGLEGLQLGFESSAAEEIQKVVPSATVVKAFNTVSSMVMSNPSINGEAADVYISGDDEKACSTVARLTRSAGFNPLNAGALENARYIEPMAALWTKMAISGFGSDFISKLIKREA